VQEHLTTWSAGGGSLPVFHDPVERSRAAFAALVGVPVDDVAVGSQVSVAVGMVAASLPAGSHVVLPDNDFTSLLWPFLVRDDLRCELVPLAEVPDAVARGCDWAAASTVQSAGGAVLDLVALRAAADATGARVLLDATQSAGWLPLDAAQWDVVVAGAYKWLLSPRGSAFTVVAPDVLADLTPTGPGWFAGRDVTASYYGGPGAPGGRRPPAGRLGSVGVLGRHRARRSSC
jgi:selenocysteine lyase/cysteine desulfurase